jgi:hypothetical protein
MLRKQLHPDASGAGSTAPTTTTKKTIGNIPRKDADLDTLAKAANAKWKTLPALTLLWTTQAAYETLVTNYSNTLLGRLQSGGQLPSKLKTLKQVDADINKATAVVKTYIIEKFEGEKNAKSEYARYGFAKKSKGYVFPTDRDERKNALQLMKTAIAADGFADKKYGTAFWSSTITDFEAAYAATEAATKNVSTGVSAKDVLRKQIEQHLNAFIHLIKANYTTTWEAELRAWGF